MDHIKCPHHEAWAIEVPYLTDPSHPFVFDNLGWYTYLQRVGWSYQILCDTINNKQGSPHPDRTRFRAASLVQAWLYFGLMNAVTEGPVDTGDFITITSEGTQIVNTRCLPEYLDRWRSRCSAIASDKLDDYIQSLDCFLKTMHLYLPRLITVKNCVVPPGVRLSIQILWETMTEYKMQMFPNSAMIEPVLAGYGHEEISSHLACRGWCKNDLTRLTQRVGTITRYYMGAAQPRIYRRSHADCTPLACTALEAVDKQYAPRHESSTCACSECELDISQLKLIIAGDSVPIIHFSDHNRLEIHAFKSGTANHIPYVAISHVWADGLGNPQRNAMNQCQLRLLQDRVSSLMQQVRQTSTHFTSEKPYFWIDTLCVPAQECTEKTVAIAGMENVYKDAVAVLVVDSELETAGSECSLVDIALMIASSKWMTRLWTIQEAAFARELYFQLRHTAVSLHDLQQTSATTGRSHALVWNSDAVIIKQALSNFTLLNLSAIRADRGFNVLRDMTWRFTSRSCDEVICLSILLGLGHDKIASLHRLSEDPHERMASFLLMQRFVPWDMIFWVRAGPGYQLSVPGFSWAASTFLSRQTYWTSPRLFVSDVLSPTLASAFNLRYAEIDSKGYHIDCPGLSLDLSPYSRKGTATLDLFVEDISTPYMIQLLDEENLNLTWDFFAGLKSPVIISPLESGAKAPNNVKLGILLDEIRLDSNEMLCVFQAKLIVLALHWNVGVKPDMEMGNTGIARCSANRKWCIR